MFCCEVVYLIIKRAEANGGHYSTQKYMCRVLWVKDIRDEEETKVIIILGSCL